MEYGKQEHTDVRHFLIIPEGMKSIVQIGSFPSLCTLEATQMAGVAKLLHCDMNNFIFDANDSIPLVWSL